MAVALGGHVVAPLDAGIVIIVERGGGYTVVNGVAKIAEAGDHVSRVDGEAGAHVGSSNLCLA